MWGMAVFPDSKSLDHNILLADGRKVSIEEAIFRSSEAFKPSNLKDHLHFWETEILKDHPNKVSILKWLTGVKIEEFLQSFTIFKESPCIILPRESVV